MALQLTVEDLQAIRGVFQEELREGLQGTEEKLNKRMNALDERIEDTNARMEQQFQGYDAKLEQRFGDYDAKLGQRFGDYDEKLEQQFQDIRNTIDEKIHDSEVMLLSEMERLHDSYIKRFDRTDARIDKLTDTVNAIKIDQDATKLLLKVYDRVWDSQENLNIRVTRLEQVMV